MMYLDPQAANRRSMYGVAYAFYIVATVFTAFFIFPMIWSIPMTVRMKQACDQVGTPNEQSHLCVSIFGILLFPLIGWVGSICGIIASANFNSNKMTMPNFSTGYNPYTNSDITK